MEPCVEGSAIIKLKSVTLLGIDGAGNRPNITKAMHHSMRGLEFEDVILISPHADYVGMDKINHKIVDKMSFEEWNIFVWNGLKEYIETDYYLFVDTDGFVVNPNRWTDEFYDYDYIGARWGSAGDHPHITYCENEKVPCSNNVGNGGFTFRSKKFLEEASKLKHDGYSPEDAFLCLKNYHYLISQGIKFAPGELADQFSIELRVTDAFGFHGVTNHLDYTIFKIT